MSGILRAELIGTALSEQPLITRSPPDDHRIVIGSSSGDDRVISA